jgi:hypothetical protein
LFWYVFPLLTLSSLERSWLLTWLDVQTQKFRTGHQVLGLLTIALMTIMVGWGGALSYIKRSAKQRSQEPPESTQLLGTIHRWIGRLIWVLFLVNVGL